MKQTDPQNQPQFPPQPRPIPKDIIKETKTYNLDHLYERASDELSLQQHKRDQIITIYLALSSFVIPLSYSLAELSMLAKGLIFLVLGMIGILFTLISVRYRVYKEVYWLCCQTITCLMAVKESAINKDVIQDLFYRTMHKKGQDYVAGPETKRYWDRRRYFRKNIFSSETLHFIIIDFISSVLTGLSVFIILYSEVPMPVSLPIAIAVGLACFAVLMTVYFEQCRIVYGVLVSGTGRDFNITFGKAWFLHLYLE